MNRHLKYAIRGLKWSFSVIGVSFTLAVLILILLNGYAYINEADTPWLMAEIGLFGFGLILQFIPLKD